MSSKDLRIGSFPPIGPWILAPMAGVSEMPFRCMTLKMGASAAPTELVSAKGLLYGQARTARYLTHDPLIETPFWVQLFGGDPESMAVGAERAAELGAKIIDINMGCPVRKVTRHGAGSALMQDPSRAAAIVEAIAKRTGLPVTCKIRAGWDAHSVNALELCKALADSGCVALAIHGRTRTQGYSGKADWELIRSVAQNASIPIIGNGDIVSAAEARMRLAESGCAAVMIGRGALGRPWLFEELAGLRTGPPKGDALWALVSKHLDAHLNFHGGGLRAIKRFRPHLIWYAHGLRDAAKFRAQVTQMEDLDEILDRAGLFFSQSARQEDNTMPECDTRTALG